MSIKFDNGTHKIEVFNEIELTSYKRISMTDFGELLPDAVIVELEDMKIDKAAGAAKRQAAARVLLRIASGVQIDAYSDKLTNLLTLLATHTSLTPTQAAAILAELKS